MHLFSCLTGKLNKLTGKLYISLLLVRHLVARLPAAPRRAPCALLPLPGRPPRPAASVTAPRSAATRQRAMGQAVHRRGGARRRADDRSTSGAECRSLAGGCARAARQQPAQGGARRTRARLLRCLLRRRGTSRRARQRSFLWVRASEQTKIERHKNDNMKSPFRSNKNVR